jgi:hypothetical protein
MAVSITKKLTVSPSSGSLTLPITLQQSLTTNIPGEQAATVYVLNDPSGDVVFGSTGTKTFTTSKTVDRNSPPFQDQDTLVGTLTGAILDIQQTLTDQSGSVLTSHCAVALI